MSGNEKKNDACEKPKTIKVVLRDLETLLRKTIGDELIVVKYETESLLPKGENYGSTILKVEADVKKSKNSAVEKLHLVAKMTVATDFQKEHFNSTVSFVKEIFVFEELIPRYRKLQLKYGFDKSELIDVLPKFYGSRLSLNPSSIEADDDVVMLMENLKIKGYRTMDRRNGLDFNHAKLAITELSKYHAMGIACKEKDKDFFEKAKPAMTSVMVKSVDAFEEAIDSLILHLCGDQRLVKYSDRIEKSLKRGFSSFLKEGSDGTWSTFTHGDFWVNNMLFSHDDQDKAVDIKFVDFQIANFYSAMRDLPYFLCGSCSTEVLNSNFNELLDLYYNTFIGLLKKMKCKIDKFSRESFNQELKTVAEDSFLICIVILQFVTQDVAEDFDENDMVSIMKEEPNSIFKERACYVVHKFVEMGWI